MTIDGFPVTVGDGVPSIEGVIIAMMRREIVSAPPDEDLWGPVPSLQEIEIAAIEATLPFDGDPLVPSYPPSDEDRQKWGDVFAPLREGTVNVDIHIMPDLEAMRWSGLRDAKRALAALHEWKRRQATA